MQDFGRLLTARKDAFITDLRRSIRSRGLDIRSLRHLGAGGTGLATLFEVRSSGGGVRKRFVIKSSRIPNDPVLPYEKNIQLVCCAWTSPPGGRDIPAARG